MRLPVTYTAVPGSPFTLPAGGAWTKVAIVPASAKGLRIGVPAAATAYDIEWVSYPAGTYASADLVPDTVGEAVLAGEDFPGGVPIGDLYLRSASGQVAIVKLGA